MAFDPETRSWQTTVLLVGVGLAVVPALLSLNVYVPGEAATFGGVLLGIFLLAYGANRLQLWMARPPITAVRGALLGVVAFIPIFLGTLPSGPVLQRLAGNHDYENTPSAIWTLAVLLWGLFAPVGVLGEGLRRFRADLNGNPR